MSERTLAAAPSRRWALPPLARVRSVALRFASPLVLLALWEIIGRLGLIRPFLLPPLEAVVARLGEDIADGALLNNAVITLYHALAGFVLSVAVGVPLGLLIARRRAFRWFCEPVVSVGFPMPKIAFLPIFMLWFGVFDLSKIVMVAFSTVFTVIAAADAGARGVETRLVWSAQSLGARSLAVFWEVALPASMPQILTGLQVALPQSMIIAVGAEMLMGGAGLGGAMMQAGSYADSVGVYVGIVETAAVGMIAVVLMARLRAWLLRWHAEFNPR
jgi:taurine transport system permease protein